MVGVARIELATPAMSTQCSTTELHAHTFRGDAPLIAPARLGKPFARTIPLLLVRPVGAAEQRVDLAHQILEVKGLRQQLGLRHILVVAPGYPGTPGAEQPPRLPPRPGRWLGPC